MKTPIPYILGLLVGICFGLLLLLLFRVRKEGSPRQYDERQIAGQGKAYKAGFFTLLICDALCCVLEFADGLPGEPLIWHVCALMAGVGVFAVTAIHFDSYISLNSSPKQYYFMGGCFIIAESCIAITNFRSDDPDNMVMAVISLMVALLWVIVLLALLIHRKRTKAEEQE